MARTSDWVLTINNPSESDFNLVELLSQNKEMTKYFVAQTEVGEQGTPHIQAFVQFTERKRLTQLKKIAPTWHWEPRRGSAAQAAAYCKKSETHDGQFRIEEGSMTTQGKRTDIQAFVEAAQNLDISETEIIAAQPETYVKYFKALDRIKSLTLRKETKKFRQLTTHVYYGPPGTGKTRIVMDKYGDDVYKLSVGNDTKVWFDGYDGEDVLLIDDYDGSWIPYELMLALLDGYQLRLPIKGSHTYARYTKVFITSNIHPHKWWYNGLRALARRINKIFWVKEKDAISEISYIPPPSSASPTRSQTGGS